MNLKKLIQLRWFCVILMFALIICIPLPAFADSAEVDVTVTVPQTLCVFYTGGDVIFNLDCYDLHIEGSKGIVDQGDIIWCSSIAPWQVWVWRDPWYTVDGDQDLEFWLRIKWGPPQNDRWYTVGLYSEIDPEDPWLFGDSEGSGTYEGVDWKLKNLSWDMQPGTYTTTVYFLIEGV